MIYTIRVTSKNNLDPKGQDLLAEIKRTLKISSIVKIRTAKVYRLQGLSKDKAQKFAQTALFETIDQTATFDGQLFKGANHLVEVAYKPAVMNPEVASILKSAQDLGINIKAADSSSLYAFYGKLSKT